MMTTKRFDADGITVYHGDGRAVAAGITGPIRCLVYDPPWDDEQLLAWTPPDAANVLVFTDPRRIGDALDKFGSRPAWTFVWDTMNTWQAGPRRPVQQCKLCLWYGDRDSYARDATLWGDAPPARDHPGTKHVPLDGRRLTDVWRESLRWLHNPKSHATEGSERFTKHGNPGWRHAKPLGWMRCLIGNCGADTDGIVFDPFMGTGTALVGARDLQLPAIGVDCDGECCDIAIDRLSQTVLAL